MPVLDASIVVAYLSGGPGANAARAVVRDHPRTLWAPELIDAEVGQVLRRIVARGELTAAAGRSALDDLVGLPLVRAPHAGLMRRAWALRENVSFYDALYVALAEAVGEPLVTLDRRLAGASGVAADVIVLD